MAAQFSSRPAKKTTATPTKGASTQPSKASKPARSSSPRAASRPTAGGSIPASTQGKGPSRRASGRDLQSFQSLLEEERKRLLVERERIEARTARHDRLLGGPESQYDDHMADIATESQDREIDLASQDNVDELLEEVSVALEKIRTGTYGLCDVCGKTITKARLLALPYATLCIECQSLIEE